MKTLVVYYSKSGNTRCVAKEIARALSAETEEIVEIGVKRTGILGFLRAGRGGMMRKKSRIETPKKRPGDYDLVFIGSPVWGWNLAPAVRSYLAAVDLGQKPIALFCTMGANGEKKTFDSVRELAPGSRALGELAVLQSELENADALARKVGAWAKEMAGTLR
jgi:flavodoxin